jgi:arylsulfatase A-like enzyme
MKVPGITVPGSISAVPVIASDLYPTLLKLIKQPLIADQHADGVSIVPALQGNVIEDRSLIWHYPHYSNQDGQPSGVVRKGAWKLIYNYQSREQELYNLQSDLMETRNLVDQFPHISDSLTAILMGHLEEVNALFPKKDPAYSAARESIRLRNSREKRMSRLEEQRREFLSPDFNPGNNWWGSNPN